MNKGKLISIFNVIKEYCNKFCKFIDNNFYALIFLTYIIISLFNVRSEKFQFLFTLALIVIMSLIMHKVLHKALEDQIKKEYKRFTVKKPNGDIIIEEERLNQAIIFMSILEDEYEKK